MDVAFLFLVGLAVGSFLNALIYRMESGESVLKGRSHCAVCFHKLAWHDLIPLASFAFLRGRCGYCHAKISFQYPLVELAAGFLFALVFLMGFSLAASLYAIFIFCLLLVIFVYDLKHFIIPDRILFTAIAITLLWRLFEMLSSYGGSAIGRNFEHWNLFGHWSLRFVISLPFVQALFSAITAGLFFLTLYVLSRGKWMGFGDVKFALFMGLFLAWPNIVVALFAAFLIGALAGILLVLLRKKQFSSEVPFAPFLVLGTFVAFFWGNGIAQWYLKFLY